MGQFSQVNTAHLSNAHEAVMAGNSRLQWKALESVAKIADTQGCLLQNSRLHAAQMFLLGGAHTSSVGSVQASLSPAFESEGSVPIGKGRFLWPVVGFPVLCLCLDCIC